MAMKASAYSRGPQILGLLYEHGPLTNWGIRELIKPDMDARRVRDAMARLLERGLVLRRFEALPKNMSYFYQISAREEHRKEIAELIGVEESKLKDLRVRDQELYHSMDCAVWVESLKRMFPEGKVIRDFRLHSNPRWKEILLMDFDDFELKPDILLHLPKTAESPEVNIAFEIERSRKSPKRIERKLRKFAMATRIDGLIYATNDEGIQDLVRKIWLTKNSSDRLRIGHYDQNFLMFASNKPYWMNHDLFMFTAAQSARALGPWMSVLRKYERNDRRDKYFEPSAEVG